MAEPQPKGLTLAERQASRTGRCIARIGPTELCPCEAYEHDRVADGFRTCVCNHTQWGHRAE